MAMARSDYDAQAAEEALTRFFKALEEPRQLDREDTRNAILACHAYALCSIATSLEKLAGVVCTELPLNTEAMKGVLEAFALLKVEYDRRHP